ncbi:hypothetical protein SAMN04488502_10372 [Dendrosporobacter quercicolus]|uniref:Uncharacterized protein n=1 Tax=Dendrosporobacter quercicolus TaxID=146817 RepID=A0A1G9RQM5_9FIRM|nr:hypothetical protein SAMN04488502_10372 [Dendrosporobacter quercicolus]
MTLSGGSRVSELVARIRKGGVAFLMGGKRQAAVQSAAGAAGRK